MNMCPTKQTYRSYGGLCPRSSDSTATTVEWISEAINGGSLRHVDLHTGTNGWASPPGDLFSLRSNNYFTKRIKSPSGDYLLSPAGMDWLKSTAKLENVLARPDNRVSLALRRAQAQGKSLKTFTLAVNLQVHDKDHHSALKKMSQINTYSQLNATISLRSDSRLNGVDGDDNGAVAW